MARRLPSPQDNADDKLRDSTTEDVQADETEVAEQAGLDSQRLEDEEFLEDDENFEEEGVSLEELSKTYAQMLGEPQASGDSSPAGEARLEDNGGLGLFDPQEEELDGSDSCPVTPLTILEAVLMVGRPDNGSISSSEIAALMRGVKESEIAQLIADLNQAYEESGRAFRVVEVGVGYRLQLASDLKFIADRFYGRVKEVRLNQAAIDCLALVSYQPGISREKLETQRGHPSGAVLNQLVRRQLLEMRREGAGNKLSPHYYPTERLLQLAGLASLEDLPQVEEWE